MRKESNLINPSYFQVMNSTFSYVSEEKRFELPPFCSVLVLNITGQIVMDNICSCVVDQEPKDVRLYINSQQPKQQLPKCT